jgi:ketosteroid isomerase-like protein
MIVHLAVTLVLSGTAPHGGSTVVRGAPSAVRTPAVGAHSVPNGDSAAVAAVIRALFAAAERNDLAALDTLYAGDSLIVIEGAGINLGWTDYRDHHLEPELKEMKDLQYRASDIEVHLAGNTAWAIFRYTLKVEMDGKPADLVGRGTAVLELRGSRWVVRLTQTSGRARRPTDPPAD